MSLEENVQIAFSELIVKDATIKELRELLVGSERMLRNNAAVLRADLHNHDATYTEELADKLQAALKKDSIPISGKDWEPTYIAFCEAIGRDKTLPLPVVALLLICEFWKFITGQETVYQVMNRAKGELSESRTS